MAGRKRQTMAARRLGVSPRSLTPILLQKYRDTNGRCMLYKWVVYIRLSSKKRAYFCKSIAIEMGSVSRYFTKIWGWGVGVTLLSRKWDVARTQLHLTLPYLYPMSLFLDLHQVPLEKRLEKLEELLQWHCLKEVAVALLSLWVKWMLRSSTLMHEILSSDLCWLVIYLP